jgi:anti-sigma regulatory factor (Ser/Thr protein kinase)
MHFIPIITSDSSIIKITTEVLSLFEDEELVLAPLNNLEDAFEYLSFEMPELLIVNFSDSSIDSFDLLTRQMSDSWLLHGGIIGLCKTNKEIERLENMRGANLIIALCHEELSLYLSKVLTVIFNNRRILFQREISVDFFRNISGSFKLDNDSYEVKCYVNLICNFLYNSNRIRLEQKFNLKLALTEMLMNAIEHGNCEITYEEKTEWLEKSLDISDLIAKKNENEDVKLRKISFEYTLTQEKGTFYICDEGNGFDWRNVKDVTLDENILELHGRGILITRALVDNLTFNQKGNGVTFEVPFERERAGMMPGLFESIPVKEISAGETIFSQGDQSNYLYYIVKGIYNVIVDGIKVSSLSPDDIFMGEMSFLLNDKRSATIKAETDGRLIEISKKDFVEAIRLKPYYALFLCRLLAQRIERSNIRK